MIFNTCDRNTVRTWPITDGNFSIAVCTIETGGRGGLINEEEKKRLLCHYSIDLLTNLLFRAYQATQSKKQHYTSSYQSSVPY